MNSARILLARLGTKLPEGLRRHAVAFSLAGVALAVLLAFTLAPKEVEVDIGEVHRGPMEVTVDEDGITRYRQVYRVTAPLAGEVQRIAWESGDRVRSGETLATILPGPSSLLDPRARQEAEARAKAAEAARERADAEVRLAAVELEKAERYVERDERRVAEKLVAPPVLEDSRQAYRLALSAHEAAVAAREMARFDLRVAEAALRSGSGEGGGAPGGFALTAPIDGVVLDVPEESRRVVAPGEQILEIGDPTSLEVRADILSQDAVRVRPGQRVRIDHWGGEDVLFGTVTRVEPAAFTKVSALGVDEQRVWVTIGLEPPEAGGGSSGPMGHGYRVEVKIVIWEAPDVLLVPAGAVFRSGEGWGVFRVGSGDRAEAVPFRAGRRNAAVVEVTEGLQTGDRVVLHPGDRVGPGTRLRLRHDGRP